jgi:hypothetical protein
VSEVLLHLNLEEVLLDLVPLYFRLTRVFNQDARGLVLLDDVVNNVAIGGVSCQNSTSGITFNHIVSDKAFRLDHNYSIVVAQDLVILDDQLLLTLHNKNAFTFALFDVVKFNSGVAREYSSYGNVSFYILKDFVGKYYSRGPFDDQNSLVVILLDYVSVGERLGVNRSQNLFLYGVHF